MLVFNTDLTCVYLSAFTALFEWAEAACLVEAANFGWPWWPFGLRFHQLVFTIFARCTCRASLRAAVAYRPLEVGKVAGCFESLTLDLVLMIQLQILWDATVDLESVLSAHEGSCFWSGYCRLYCRFVSCRALLWRHLIDKEFGVVRLVLHELLEGRVRVTVETKQWFLLYSGWAV